MKIKINPIGDSRCFITLTQGNQQFRLDYEGSLAECRWYAKMFRIALANHDAEVIEKYFKGDAR